MHRLIQFSSGLTLSFYVRASRAISFPILIVFNWTRFGFRYLSNLINFTIKIVQRFQMLLRLAVGRSIGPSVWSVGRSITCYLFFSSRDLEMARNDQETFYGLGNKKMHQLLGVISQPNLNRFQKNMKGLESHFNFQQSERQYSFLACFVQKLSI